MTKPIKYRLHKEWHEALSRAREHKPLRYCAVAVEKAVDRWLWSRTVWRATEQHYVFFLLHFNVMRPLMESTRLDLR